MIKLTSIMTEGKNRYFYHATTCKALPGIVARGLLPNEGETTWGGDLGKFSEDKVFMTTTFIMADYYGNAGIWGKQHYNQFKPLLRFRHSSWDLLPDPQTSGDYYSEIPIKGRFEIFVPDETQEVGSDGRVYYKEGNGTWRPLTKNIADAIYHGEWDGEIIDDEDEV